MQLNMVFLFLLPLSKGFHLYDENIFVYKKALKNCGDWKKYLDNSYKALEEIKDTYEFCEEIKERLDVMGTLLIDKPKN